MALHCSECGFVNTEGANYCQKCGALLAHEPGGEPATATYRVGETGDFIAIDIAEVAAHAAALVIRSGGGRAGESFEVTGERMTIEIKVAGYVRREEIAIEKAAKSERVAIPEAFEYATITALSREAREKLTAQRPRTLGGASRIPGVTPADVAILSLYVRREEEAASA